MNFKRSKPFERLLRERERMPWGILEKLGRIACRDLKNVDAHYHFTLLWRDAKGKTRKETVSGETYVTPNKKFSRSKRRLQPVRTQ